MSAEFQNLGLQLETLIRKIVKEDLKYDHLLLLIKRTVKEEIEIYDKRQLINQPYSIRIEDSIFKQVKRKRRNCKHTLLKSQEHIDIVYELKKACIDWAKEHPMETRTRADKKVYKEMRMKWFSARKEFKIEENKE
jgi:hypothetical protein